MEVYIETSLKPSVQIADKYDFIKQYKAEFLLSITCAVEQQATLESCDFRRNFLKFSDGLAAFDGELEDQ